MTRRDLLRMGGVAGMAAALGGAGASGEAIRRAPGFGRARSCLIVFLSGGPSHLDTFDPKPDAPAEIRGEFRSIETVVPGMRVCEHLPGLARQAGRLALIRGMTHDRSDHAGAIYRMMTGRAVGLGAGPGDGLSRSDEPHIGSVVSAVAGGASGAVPAFAMVPGYLEPGGPVRAGQDAGRLGPRFDPVVLDPRPARRGPASSGAADVGPAIARALELDREHPRVRERYGPDRFGRSLLLGRRLIEAGARLVQVNWLRDDGIGWDTHTDHFPTLARGLLPTLDRGLSALLGDMASSGLLDQTLVVVTGEFGRSPRVSPVSAGRGDWPSVFTAVAAGAGLDAGRWYGSSDRQGAYPLEGPVAPGRLAATILHALGLPGEGDDRPATGLWGGPIA